MKGRLFLKRQVAGAGFRGPLLICLLNLTLNEKMVSHTFVKIFTLKKPTLIIKE